jgi:hypothetical protein
MAGEKELPVIMECDAGYSLKENNGQEFAGGESHLLLDEEKLSVIPASGEPLLIPYREIVQYAGKDYRFEAELVSGEKLTIFSLGYKYEDFLRYFSQLFNEVALKDLLMNENILKPGVEAAFSFTGNDKKEQAGQCELRLYETALVLISSQGDFVRIPYSDVMKVRIEDYSLILETEYGESWAFYRMGKELEIFHKTLNDALNALSIKTQNILKELLPGFDSSIIRRAAGLMKDGRAARRSDIDALAPGIWEEMEKKLAELGIREEYDFLKSQAEPGKMCIGIKRGLMGDLTGEYIWFLAPIYSIDPARPGNIIAMEAAVSEASGKATYFFKITEREDYLKIQDPAALEKMVDAALRNLNRYMIAINFRREPIYLSDEQLSSPSHISYRRAVDRIPALRELRRLYAGRVIHHSAEQWQQAIRQILNSTAGGV